MQRSTIIKLRQAESSDIVTNGEFSTTLAGQGIVMKEGDMVKIHTAILDTTTEAVITLDKDQEINMTTIKYWCNSNAPTLTTGHEVPYSLDPVAIPAPDLKNYFK